MFEVLLQELVGNRNLLQERAEGIAFLRVAKSLYPLDRVAYLGLNIPFAAQRARFVHCSYSDAGIKQFASQDVIAPARLGALGTALQQALDWSSLRDSPETQALLRLANGAAHDLRLLSLPLRAIAGELGLLCVGTALPTDEWEGQKEMLMREFQVLGNYFHQHILRIYGNDVDRDILVSARELDCLKWMAAGKTAWEASVILGISERTVRFHLNAAREKLNCITTTQAVAKAVSQRLI
jgi:DNA-binding CsgD family transcriptional regulator